MTVTEARRYFGSNYAIAKVLDVDRSTVGRWDAVPDEYVKQLYCYISMNGIVKKFNGRKRK